MLIEMTSLRSKVERLNMIVTPLMAITDLSLAKKRIDQSANFSNDSGEEVNVNMMTGEERLQQLEHMNPQLILSNLADYCNTQDMPKKRLDQMERRFMGVDDFNRFKIELEKDSAQSKAIADLEKKVREAYSKISDMETSVQTTESDMALVR